MISEKRHPSNPVRRSETNRFDRLAQRLLRMRPVFAASIVLLFGVPAAQSDDPDGDRDDDRGASHAQLRRFIDRQVGGIDKLKVPATEVKRFLGKLLFHDPVRTTRININQGQPADLPVGTAFGGTVNASDPNVQAIVNATKQTGSCGSCHFGEAASKAGQVAQLARRRRGPWLHRREGQLHRPPSAPGHSHQAALRPLNP